MNQKKEPTIKGIFVNSHINAVRREKGEAGVRELEKRYGSAIKFTNLEDVLVSDEISIIELALDIISNTSVPDGKRAFEAGRLHFQNFTTTPLAKIIFSTFTEPKKMFLNSKYIAEHVFNGITFTSTDEGPNKVKVIMEGGHYPLDHFKGLFWEWINYFKLKPSIEAKQTSPERYEYLLQWK